MTSALLEARQRGNAMLDRCRSSVPFSHKGIEAILGAQGGGSANVLSRQQNLSMATEQYRHFIGWTHSIIRIIAQRICSQPLRVAKPVQREEVRRLEGIIQKSQHYASWQVEYARERMRSINQSRLDKRRMPPFLKSYRRELEVVEDHPILRAIEKPNPLMVRYVFLFVTIASLELTGRSYWWFTREDQMRPGFPANSLQIWPLPTSWVEPYHDQDQLFKEWIITAPGGGSPKRVPGNEIVQIYYPDPSNPLGCFGPLQAQARAVVVDEATLEAQRRGFSNGLYPGLALIVGRDPDLAGGVKGARPILSREQRAQIMAAFKQAYRGVQNMEEPVILDALIEDIKPITTVPKDMAFLDTAKASKERMSQGWGVNPVSMGQLEGANRASSHTADGHLCVNVLNPRIELVSETMTRFLPSAFSAEPGVSGDELVYFEECKTIDEDTERENQKFMADQAAITRNEIRQHNGLPPIKGGNSCYVNNTLRVDVELEETVLYDQGDVVDDVGTSDGDDPAEGV